MNRELTKRIIIFYDYFSPAYKAGGPIRSIDNLVKLTGNEVQFYVYTTNQDLDGTVLNVQADQWVNYENKAQICYASRPYRSLKFIRHMIEDVKPDQIYINGMFSMLCVIYPLMISRSLKIPIIIAPRGMLQAGALKLKSFKKKIYLYFFKIQIKGVNIKWHATDAVEVADIKRTINKNAEVFEVGNVPLMNSFSNSREKNSVVKFVTISLVARKKNIGQFISALKDLPELDGRYEYHIFGPVKDAEYMDELKNLVNTGDIEGIYFHGPVQPKEVCSKLSEFDFFVLPTLGENFGHAIFEAFSAGLPVIISDQTPWRDLEAKRAGWDVSLDDPNALREAIQKAMSMSSEEYQQWSRSARRLAETYVEEAGLKEKYLELFGGVVHPLPPASGGYVI